MRAEIDPNSSAEFHTGLGRHPDFRLLGEGIARLDRTKIVILGDAEFARADALSHEKKTGGDEADANECSA
jgi:hypothetical protein